MYPVDISCGSGNLGFNRDVEFIKLAKLVSVVPSLGRTRLLYALEIPTSFDTTQNLTLSLAPIKLGRAYHYASSLFEVLDKWLSMPKIRAYNQSHLLTALEAF